MSMTACRAYATGWGVVWCGGAGAGGRKLMLRGVRQQATTTYLLGILVQRVLRVARHLPDQLLQLRLSDHFVEPELVGVALRHAPVLAARRRHRAGATVVCRTTIHPPSQFPSLEIGLRRPQKSCCD